MSTKAVYDKIEFRQARVETVKEGQAFRQHTVSFDCPITEPYLIPVIHNSTPSCINVPFMVEGVAYNVTSFSLQNSAGARPFGVVETDNLDAMDVSLHGQALCTHPLFPSGADIVFVQIEHNNLIKARLYEKEGVEPDFSERGACAAFVAARILDKTYGSALVAMGGKTCCVEWDGVDGDVKLSGYE